MLDKSGEDISFWLWLSFPVLIFFTILIINFFLSSYGVDVNSSIHGQNFGSFYYINDQKYFYYNLADFLLNHENGLIETGTFILLVIAIFFGLKIIKSRKLLPSSYLIIWFLFITLACLYFAGEEISWGQHIIGWTTPDLLNQINDQGETNIHNISSWFDQKPRLILELCVFFGGIIFPLYIKIYGATYKSNNWKYWIIPTLNFIPIAILVILVKILDRLDTLNYELYINNSSLNLFQEYYFLIFYGIRLNETQELFFAYYLMLYLYITYKKIISLR